MKTGEVLQKEGNYHVKIQTGLNPARDENKVNSYVTDLTNACRKASVVLKKDCTLHCALPTIRQLAEKTLQIIEPSFKLKTERQRRSTKEHGKLARFIIYLFWNDDETEDSSPMGIVQHAVNDFEKIEQQLQSNQVKYEQQFANALSKIQEEDERIITNFDISGTQRQLQQLSNVVRFNLNNLLDAYNGLETTKLTEDEMEKIIVKVNNVLIDCEVPKLTNRQLSRMIEATVKLIDGEYQIILSIPIVKRDVFTSYFTAPMPNAAINMIPDFDDHTIIINEINNLGIDATTAMEKN